MFKLVSKYQPSGDQPQAIKELVEGLNQGKKDQVLLGVTGSGKTFTIASVIEQVQRPVIVLSHNKTLASQLFVELKEFFPDNRVEYFISYFDYYRPEAYLPSTDTYIDKTSARNEEIEAMRMSTLNSLLTERNTIVVASVASIYGTQNPEEYELGFMKIEVGKTIKRREFFLELVKRQYERNHVSLSPGEFNVKGDVIEIYPSWTTENIIRIDLFGDEIEKISLIDPLNKTVVKTYKNYTLYPASAYVTNHTTMQNAIKLIREEFESRKEEFAQQNKLLELQRLEQRIKTDIDNLVEFSMTPGIENYSRHLDGRAEGEKPFTLLDYFPEDTLMIIDESHMMIPQIHAMYKGDRSRKMSLVEYGFRLPSALDNRPLKFEEFEKYEFQKIYVSATPEKYELARANDYATRLVIRPTGLLDPVIEVRKSENQIEDIYDELQKQIAKNERSLILTTTKRYSEELTRYFQSKKQKVAYIHSEHTTFERDEILRKLRKGIYDFVIGINLLREGIDLPEVSLIIILDADKESFMRNTRSLIQIVGRAARNQNGRVIMYADSISKSMKATIEDNEAKRAIQIAYNQEHNIIPKTVIKPIPEPIQGHGIENAVSYYLSSEKKKKEKVLAKDEVIKQLEKQMKDAAKEMNYERAAELRDLILELKADER
ncbi:excinuclease ABC subunit UvrB [Mycoplasmopsis agassizii]|uniref:UvrABC system protein B n=1 Tax=Mycoplasmopsis agassizii TaxID=33922 RepID=A0ABX4H492_9BACT|nr:excinuclease ABC subunit UvrB [Mycoplasmopsis agassizii]PAF54704.1 excinuclease ABC subunit UvrB [Mycoplasmopsis agassizii]SMC15978.1 Excinuclease ABC subunit B [Mycoplasmopsis agassizii]